MNCNPEITIIMPSYNVARYIRPCMRSVLAQTFSDFEVIAIDAGSNDGTTEILEEFASRDNRISLIRSDKKSYGYQLNLGIEKANGKYIGVVETDDIICPEMYEKLHELIDKYDVDYAKANGSYYVQVADDVFYTTEICDYRKLGILDSIIYPREHPELIVHDRYIWLGLYKKEFLIANSILLSETKGAAYQDIGFLVQVISQAERAIYIDKSVYLYRQDNENASGYSSKAFSYIKYEFEKLLFGQDALKLAHVGYVYVKMMRQYFHRFHLMASTGVFWDDEVENMEMIRKWILDAYDSEVISKEELDDNLFVRIEVLRAGVKELFGSYLVDNVRYVSKVKEWIEKVGRTNKKERQQLVVFGCGPYGQFVRCFLEKAFPGNTVAFCDNNAGEASHEILGIPVLEPCGVVKKYPSAKYVISSCKYRDEMRTQLENIGVSADRIEVYPFARDIELLID